MNALRARNRPRKSLWLRPRQRTLTATRNFYSSMQSDLQAASTTTGPVNPDTLVRVHHEFYRYIVILTVSTLRRMFAEGYPYSCAIFAMWADDVLTYMRRPCLSWPWFSQNGRVKLLLQLAATETTKKINMALALCPVTMLRDLRQSTERGPNEILHHVRKVMIFLMCNSTVGDGIHKNCGIVHRRHLGMGDAERHER